MTISTRDLSELPGIEALEALSQALAVLDAILCPEWEFRYYSFDVNWGPGLRLASMRDGEGDGYFCVFSEGGAVLKGFGHESAMSPFHRDPPRVWSGVLGELPSYFHHVIGDAGLVPDETTFCIWRTPDDDRWLRGRIDFPDSPDPDGSAGLLPILDGRPETYQAWAEAYYERPIDLDAVTHIYQQRPVTPEIIDALNPDLSLDELRADLAEIGYPG